MTHIQMTTLDNGLRIITDTIKDVESVAVGFWIDVGARNETIDNNGVSHMLEHMLFKGTHARNAQQIVESIEQVGGNMNAYTSRELTSYHCHLLKDDFDLAFDVLADMYLNSTLPDDEIEREREVILQEIGMYQDAPDDLVFDHFFEASYPDQAFGAPILGRPPIIQSMTKQQLQDHIESYYRADGTVISVAGNIDHDRVIKKVEAILGDHKKQPKSDNVAPDYRGGEMRQEKDLEQVHFILGFQGVSRTAPDTYAAQSLATILGGGMSSRLFQEIREKRGLVYSVFAFHSAFSDDGLMGVYAGTGPEKMDEIVPAICDELQKIMGDLRDEEVVRARTQLKANMLMGRESMMRRADQNAKHILLNRGELFDVAYKVKLIDAVTRKDVLTVAEKIFASPVTVSAIGNLEKLESLSSITKRMAA